MRLFSTLLTLALFTFALSAQKWNPIEDLPYEGDRRIEPHTALLFRVNGAELREQLFASPHESDGPIQDQDRPLELQLPGGETATFDIVAYDIMPAVDLARYPNIRTWYGRNRDGSGQTIYLDWTERGFHASIIQGGNTIHIEPLFRGDTDLYQVFNVKDFNEEDIEPMSCGSVEMKELDFGTPTTNKSVGDCELRQYRTAISTNYGYSNYHGATSAAQASLVQSAVITALNRANQIMTEALSLRQQLIAGNDRLYVYSQANDPFDDDNIGNSLDINQTFIDSRVGNSSYDHGHLFIGSTSRGGIAYRPSSCRSGSKAGAVSTRTRPEGFFFDTRLLTHEMGHSFGAPHTYSNVCNGQGGNPAEPGSGSTLMSYGGTCEPNVVGVVEGYFHGRSIEQMTSYLEINDGSRCGTIVDVSLNNANIVPRPDYVIPTGTPIRLEAVASGSNLLYNWDQSETVSVPGVPQSSQTQGTIFRSFAPTTDPVRFIPQLPEVLAGNNPTWEVLPEVDRRIIFQATVTSRNSTYGCATEDNVNVDVVATPNDARFKVTYPNGPNQWASGRMNAVIWDVAGTDAAPYNTSTVDILYSADGGDTFTPVIENTPNDGYAEFSIAAPSDNARVIVAAADNVFFNVNDNGINVTSSVSAPGISISSAQSNAGISCAGATDFKVTTASTGGATAPITWTISGLPAGATPVYNQNPTRPTQTLRIGIDGADNLPNGNYNLTLTGSSADGTLSQALQLSISRNGPANFDRVVGPLSESGSLRPRLIAVEEADVTYEHELRAMDGSNALLFATAGAARIVTVPDFLEPDTPYRYRTRVRSNCGNSDWSEEIFMTPATCIYLSTTDAPQAINPNLTQQVVAQSITFPEGGTITEMNVREVDVTHSWIADLRLDLVAPNGETVRLLNRPCRDQNNILAGWVDRAPDAFVCPPVNGELLSPADGSLSDFADMDLTGTWQLRLSDVADGDGGSLNSFTLQVCYTGELFPVEWLSFAVSPQKDHLQLDWATASEVDNAGFYVERALADNGNNWTDLGFVAAATDYVYADRTALPHTDYLYRLRQTDVDGATSYSDIRPGRFGDDGALNLLLFPNPTSGSIQYRVAEPLAYSLLDMTGRELQSGTLQTAGSLDLAELPNGVYLLRAGDFTRRVVKH